MKKLILNLFALLIVLGSTAQTWNYVNSSGTDFILYGLSFPPGQSAVGYACGMDGTYNQPGIIVKTTDGGDNWSEVWPVSGSIDGLQAIWFINELTGFAGGWNNYFVKTTDGGSTWTPVSCGGDVWYYTDIEFWDSNNGAVCAYMNSVVSSIFITDDGGLTWTPASSGATANMMNLCYADVNTLFAVSANGTAYKSTDGGHNWSTTGSPGGLLFGVSFADANFGVIGAEEKIHATTNGGSSWTTFTTGYENFYATVAYADGTSYVAEEEQMKIFMLQRILEPHGLWIIMGPVAQHSTVSGLLPMVL